MSKKLVLGLAVVVVMALASVGLRGSASADGPWDGCPPGQFNLEQGCVLCLPGYAPQATGATSDHGYACYICAKTRSATAIGPKEICRVQQQVLSQPF